MKLKFNVKILLMAVLSLYVSLFTSITSLVGAQKIEEGNTTSSTQNVVKSPSCKVNMSIDINTSEITEFLISKKISSSLMSLKGTILGGTILSSSATLIGILMGKSLASIAVLSLSGFVLGTVITAASGLYFLCSSSVSASKIINNIISQSGESQPIVYAHT